MYSNSLKIYCINNTGASGGKYFRSLHLTFLICKRGEVIVLYGLLGIKQYILYKLMANVPQMLFLMIKIIISPKKWPGCCDGGCFLSHLRAHRICSKKKGPYLMKVGSKLPDQCVCQSRASQPWSCINFTTESLEACWWARERVYPAPQQEVHWDCHLPFHLGITSL